VRLPGLAAALVLACRLSPAAPAAAQGPDPFYLDLERAGQVALSRGDAPGAERRLRVACFGMLELPDRLAACLVRLALAEARADDRPGFLATFGRLDALEERFDVYRRAPLATGERAEFEARLEEWAEPALLEARPAFAALAARRTLAGAEAALGERRAGEALMRLEQVPLELRSERFWCLRGAALAAVGRCEEGASAFASCHPEREARFAAPALECLTGLGRDEEARRLAESAPEAVRADRDVRRMVRRIAAP
jgi:hypothetical protein